MAGLTSMVCIHCGSDYRIKGAKYCCPSCGEYLLLPFCSTYLREATQKCDTFLGEGNTPLLKMPDNLPGCEGNLYIKIETGNPTGSFKDRGSALVAEEAKRQGYKQCAIASTGNAGASMAAYCSRLGLDLTVIVPENTAPGKLKQLHYYGSRIERVEGDFQAAEKRYNELLKRGYFPAGPENPFRIEGIKSMAYEIVSQAVMKRIDRFLIPVGTGGLMVSLFKGFSELKQSGVIDKIPRLDAVQLATVPSVLEEKSVSGSLPKSVASGINIANPILASEVRLAIEESGGSVFQVHDQEILLAQRELALYTGIGTEATGAVTLAAFKKGLLYGEISPDEEVVLPITGHMLKE